MVKKNLTFCTAILAHLTLLLFNSILAMDNQLHAQIPTEGLVASYRFNGNADDESGNGNHGTVVGASLTTDRFGNSDSAYRFDGVDDHILARADNLPVAERTISLWFNADRLDNRPGLMGYGGGSCGTSWFMGINNGGADKQYQMQGHCLVNRIRGGYGPEPVGQWHHWLMTTDATGTRIFIDGIEHTYSPIFVNNTNVAGKDFALGVVTSAGGTAPYTDVNVGYFNGRLDDVAIYSRALEPAEINEAFAGTLPTDYVLYYPFEGSASDESGNHNDGFVIGATLVEDRFGNPNNAYEFDGIDDYIVAAADDLPTGERTVSIWFYAEDLSSRPGILGYGGGACGTSWLMGINNGGANHYQMQGHCLVNLVQAGYAPDPILSWHHLVMLTEASGTRIFVDNEFVASNNIFVANTNVGGRDLSLGVIPSPSGFAPYVDGSIGFFDGKLDNISIYNRALDSDEIRALYYDEDPSFVFSSGFETGNTEQWSVVVP